MQSIGMKNIEARALELNRLLTDRCRRRAGEYSLHSEKNNFVPRRRWLQLRTRRVVAALAAQKIMVTEKPEGIRVATDFFNNSEDDINRSKTWKLKTPITVCRRDLRTGFLFAVLPPSSPGATSPRKSNERLHDGRLQPPVSCAIPSSQFICAPSIHQRTRFPSQHRQSLIAAHDTDAQVGFDHPATAIAPASFHRDAER